MIIKMLTKFDNFSKFSALCLLFSLFDVAIIVAVDEPSVLVLNRTGKSENSSHVSAFRSNYFR